MLKYWEFAVFFAKVNGRIGSLASRPPDAAPLLSITGCLGGVKGRLGGGVSEATGTAALRARDRKCPNKTGKRAVGKGGRSSSPEPPC